MKLAENFHCILGVRLENFPFSNDYITVWKRTSIYNANQLPDTDIGSDSNNEVSSEDNDDEKDEWARIPKSERLDFFCAPCTRHLLK